MNNRLLTFAATLAILLVLAKIYEKPLLAQVRAALVQNVDEPGRNALVLSGNSDGLNPRVFLTVPAGKHYVIDQYSGSCDVQSGFSLTNVALNAIAGGVRSTSSVAPHYQQYDGNSGGVLVNYWVGTGMGPVYADGGGTLEVEFSDNSTTGNVVKTCYANIVGHLVSNP